MTTTTTVFRATADAQTAATTKDAVTEGDGVRDLPLDFIIAELDRGVSTTRSVLSVEARLKRSAQDEEFDVRLIRDDDLVS